VTRAAGGLGEDGAGDPQVATSLHRFLEMSIDLLAVLDLDTTILEASESWRRTLRWAPDEVVGRSLLEFFHPDDMTRIEAELATLLEGGEALAVVVRVRGGDGDYRWVQGNARSDLDARRIFVTAADISDRMGLEDALRRQLELEELVASIASRLIGTEPERVPAEIERAIGELAQAMGADRAHFLRGSRRPEETTYVEWLDPSTGQRGHTPAPHPDVQRWWRDGLRSGRLIRLEDIDELEDEAPLVVESLRDDGVKSVVVVPLPVHRKFWGFLALVAIREKVRFSDDATALLRLAGECFMTALSQVDDSVALIRARQELEDRNEDLERTNEELERFAFAAAHDLKAPLARIEMALSAAGGDGAGASGTSALLDVARRAARRMAQLIEDLLAFAAAGPRVGAIERVDLDDLLDEVLSDLEPTLSERRVSVERTELPMVLGHRPLLSQLLQNLLTNAVKFARAGVEPVVQVEGRAEAGGVTIVVRDNGIGIAPEHRDDVFGVFTRLNPTESFGGSGIGLATCAKVVGHHQGRIWIEDGIDGGTAVLVWLPDAQLAASS